MGGDAIGNEIVCPIYGSVVDVLLAKALDLDNRVPISVVSRPSVDVTIIWQRRTTVQAGSARRVLRHRRSAELATHSRSELTVCYLLSSEHRWNLRPNLFRDCVQI